MFKVNLLIVPPGGGETDYALHTEVPVLPREGDCLSIADQDGDASFIVRRVWWHFRRNKYRKGFADFRDIMVEVEVAKGYNDGEVHARTCQLYATQGRHAREL